ncbi:hypothetical protein EWM64_g9721, partial [Hericium alpestre]
MYADLLSFQSEIDLLKNLNVTFSNNLLQTGTNAPTASEHCKSTPSPPFRARRLTRRRFCENGSLHNICKRFGKFPENLVAVYISQVLEGLVYLHDQGVIHRDIKGANILTTKDGAVKLADFGVASSTTTGVANDDAVVGSPYWMAPEVIEQFGATTASDIWSVGCTVIELLEGRPPYYFLKPMPALYRIVQDDCPPIPEGASPIVKDFLYHCFQKDCNLRISAKKLLRHPWMVAAKKQMSDGKSARAQSDGPTGARPLSNYNFDEAVLKVQEWNEALKSPTRPSKHPAQQRDPAARRPILSPMASPTDAAFHVSSSIPISTSLGSQLSSASSGRKVPVVPVPKAAPPLALPVPAVLQQPEEQTDNWDDDFEEGISFSKLQGPSPSPLPAPAAHTPTALEKTALEDEKPETEENAQTIRPTRSPGSAAAKPPSDIDPIVEDYSDVMWDEDDELAEKVADFRLKNSVRRGLFHPDDIKTSFGASASVPVSPGPRTAPLPDVG